MKLPLGSHTYMLQQEEDTKVHEERGHKDEELFVDVPSELGGGDLINY